MAESIDLLQCFHSSFSSLSVPDMDVRPSAASVAFTTKEPLPLSTTQATGPAPSAPPAAEPSRPPAPELERESGLGQDVDMGSKVEIEEEDIESTTKITLDQERSKATVAPRLTDVPEVFVDLSTTLGETTGATSDPEEDDDLYITTETMIFEPSITLETTTDDITFTTTEVMPTTVSSTTAKPTRARPAPTTPSSAPVRPRQPQTTPSPAPERPRQPQTTPSRAAPTESSTRSLMSSTQVGYVDSFQL